MINALCTIPAIWTLANSATIEICVLILESTCAREVEGKLAVLPSALTALRLDRRGCLPICSPLLSTISSESVGIWAYSIRKDIRDCWENKQRVIASPSSFYNSV